MRRIWQVAKRDFLATVCTKGFVIGVAFVPVMVAVAIVVTPMLFNEKAPEVHGDFAILDPSGAVTEGVAEYLAPQAIRERREGFKEKAKEAMPEAVKAIAEVQGDSFDQALDQAMEGVPAIKVVPLEEGADIEEEKAALIAAEGQKQSSRLAVAVIHDDAVTPLDGETKFGSYDLYVQEKLDDRIEDELRGGLRSSIIAARIAAADLDAERVRALTSLPRVRSTTVTEGGEKETNEIFNIMIPLAFMLLLLMSVMSSATQLMTSTIEEKSSRVVEIILSAVSPLELMAGKVLGQMGVGLLLLSVYAGLGVFGLVFASVFDLVDFALVFYLGIFFFVTYVFFASCFAAIGAAVNEASEAQSLMMPVMSTLMVPWLFWMPISRDPDSLFATILSFVPPMGSFVTLIRLSSTSPPPLWQVWLSIAVMGLSAYLMLKAAAKIFRIGLLLHGKPPTFGTLIKWIRMA